MRHLKISCYYVFSLRTPLRSIPTARALDKVTQNRQTSSPTCACKTASAREATSTSGLRIRNYLQFRNMLSCQVWEDSSFSSKSKNANHQQQTTTKVTQAWYEHVALAGGISVHFSFTFSWDSACCCARAPAPNRLCSLLGQSPLSCFPSPPRSGATSPRLPPAGDMFQQSRPRVLAVRVQLRCCHLYLPPGLCCSPSTTRGRHVSAIQVEGSRSARSAPLLQCLPSSRPLLAS